MGFKACETQWGWVSKFLTQFCPVFLGTRDPRKPGSGPCYASTYCETHDAYCKAASKPKLTTGLYKAACDAYVAATATYTQSLYE